MKKDSMAAEIRRGMKEVIREKGFGFWFREVFWYHYGKLSLVLLAVLVVVILLIVESAHKERYDFSMVLAADARMTYAFAEELEGVVQNAVGDLNGDGKIQINLQIIDLGDPEHLEANQNLLQVAFAQAENALWIMDERYSAIYCQREYFDHAANYGFTPDESYDRRISLADAPLIQRLESYIPNDVTLYASICDWTVDGKGKKEWTEAAVRALTAILDAE